MSRPHTTEELIEQFLEECYPEIVTEFTRDLIGRYYCCCQATNAEVDFRSFIQQNYVGYQTNPEKLHLNRIRCSSYVTKFIKNHAEYDPRNLGLMYQGVETTESVEDILLCFLEKCYLELVNRFVQDCVAQYDLSLEEEDDEADNSSDGEYNLTDWFHGCIQLVETEPECWKPSLSVFSEDFFVNQTTDYYQRCRWYYADEDESEDGRVEHSDSFGFQFVPNGGLLFTYNHNSNLTFAPKTIYVSNYSFMDLCTITGHLNPEWFVLNHGYVPNYIYIPNLGDTYNHGPSGFLQDVHLSSEHFGSTYTYVPEGFLQSLDYDEPEKTEEPDYQPSSAITEHTSSSRILETISPGTQSEPDRPRPTQSIIGDDARKTQSDPGRIARTNDLTLPSPTSASNSKVRPKDRRDTWTSDSMFRPGDDGPIYHDYSTLAHSPTLVRPTAQRVRSQAAVFEYADEHGR